ncbi:putative transmembrane protein [Rhizoctonia solani 123E]|uniref:Putative transmembrane protein n=1 Tax=Rhizoctonia solani 123E TaxID=1423351 RepID=A0A074RPF0_9AGAM|nr:putative transmembrane protein [Rhizoctonia solani 123E]
MTGRHPCERGRRCSCHRAGPSTPPRKKSTLLVAAALVCPVLAAPTRSLPLKLDKRVTDAGQAPDDPSEGFTHQHIQLADLIRAGLPYKYVYDPEASADHELEMEMKEANGAWVMDNAWALHGRRFGPLYATATAGITDDPLPTPTESIPPASPPTSSSAPTVLAIQSSLPTGWDSTQYARSEMYAIPLVVSFTLVIALMIGSLIGAMVIRRDRSRSRRRKKRIIEQDDDSTREKVMQSSLVSRVGRALKHRDNPEEEEEEQGRTELEQRVKTWARRSAAWRTQARLGVRRRMGRGRKRQQADGPAMDETIQEEPEPEDETRNTRPSTPIRSRPPTPILTTDNEPPPSAAPNYSSPVVPTYSSPPSAAGPSTSSPLTRIEAHPDAAPSDEPAYDGPGAGQGLPPAYRGGGLSEVARGKRPAHLSSDPVHPVTEQPRERRVWTQLDAYAFGQEGAQEPVVTAHVATDDKHVLERLHSMRGAPEQDGQGDQAVQAPREEDVFASQVSTPGGSFFPSTSVSTSASSDAGAGALPLPPSKTGTGPVARYGEADLCLPRYLDGEEEGMGVPSAPEDMVPGVVPGDLVPGDENMLPSAPECIDMGTGMVPSAPPCDEETILPSAPPALEEDASFPLADHASNSPDDRSSPAPLYNPSPAHKLPLAPPPDDTLPVAPHPTPSAPPLPHPDDTCLVPHNSARP